MMSHSQSRVQAAEIRLSFLDGLAALHGWIRSAAGSLESYVLRRFEESPADGSATRRLETYHVKGTTSLFRRILWESRIDIILCPRRTYCDLVNIIHSTQA